MALVPFFWALAEVGPKRGFLCGLGFGAAFLALEFSSVLALRPFIGGLAAVAWGLLALGGALLFGAFGAVAGWRSGPFLWAGLWVGVEALRAAGPLGLAFGSLPVALVGQPFLRAGAVGGPWLLSLGIAWTAAAIAWGLRHRYPRWLWRALLGPLVLLAIAGTWTGTFPSGELEVTLVQPNIPQGEKLDRSYIPEHIALYEGLLRGIEPGMDLVVLPENAVSAFLPEEPVYLRPFQEMARELSAPMLIGTGDIREGRIYNSVLLLGKEGEIQGTYDMVHLVPFGEYLPGRGFLAALGLEQLLEELLPVDFAHGEEPRALGPYGVAICFEAQFPGIFRELAQGGAEILVVATNDAWFGGARMLWEHFAMGALRAVETGRSYLQTATTGITGGFGPDGRPLGHLPPGETGVLTLRAPLATGLTPYVRVGDWPALGLVVLFVLVGLWRKGPGYA